MNYCQNCQDPKGGCNACRIPTDAEKEAKELLQPYSTHTCKESCYTDYGCSRQRELLSAESLYDGLLKDISQALSSARLRGRREQHEMDRQALAKAIHERQWEGDPDGAHDDCAEALNSTSPIGD